MPVSEETYKRVALEDTDNVWELVCGRLRAKPLMTTEHNEVGRALYAQLLPQLDRRQYSIAKDDGRLRRSNGSYFVPDVFVIPRAMVRRLREQPGTFEVYDDPMPLVAEVWSPSTGNYDVDEKLREYQRRGDQEIWLIHPYEHTLTAWRRQPDGSYSQTVYTGGVLQPVALPYVTITLADLFD